jgi:ABC-type polar amino acid transport system ATPase subunit
MKPVISVHNICKSFGSLSVLKDVSFEVLSGEVVVVLGPSGSGKTTLLRCLNNLVGLDGGRVEIAGSEITADSKESDMQLLRRKIGMVSQSFNLWPHKTVIENIIEAPMRVLGASRENALKEAEALLAQVELEDKKNEYPQNLSGGQQQRVAIARALAMKPEVLLLDEITSALDPELVGSVLRTIKLLARKGQSMVIVTHHISFAMQIADKILFLDGGKLLQQSSSSEFMYAQSDQRIREFIKNIPARSHEINVYEGYAEFQAYQLGTLKRFPEGSAKNTVGSSGDRWFEVMGEFYEQYERARIAKKISWRMIMNEESPLDRDVRLRYPELNEYRLIPKNIENPANFYVIEGVVVVQIFGKPGDEPAIIEINNANVAKSYQSYFNLLWEQSTPIR